MIALVALLILLSYNIVVVVHELGHLATSRILGVDIDEFSVGTGPVLLQRKFGGTVYSLRLLFLLGGSVRVADASSEGGLNSFAARKPWQRAAILLTGPLFNVLLTLLVLTAFFLLEKASITAFGAAAEKVDELVGLLAGFVSALATGDNLHSSLPTLLKAATSEASGPVGMYLEVLALVSLYLGLFNLIPVLPLDGGQLLFVLLEKLLGRPVNPRTVGKATAFGTAFVAVLILFVTFEDLAMIFSRLSLLLL